MPPTTAERYLGIDAALTPGDVRIWKLLGLREPKGVPLDQTTFPRWPTVLGPGATPTFLTSLFVQYKRPDYLTTANAREWTDHQQPYFRMHLTAHQHQLLLDLTQTVGSDGTVVYAAPSFWKYDDMWLHQGATEIMEKSMFIEASTIGPGHSLWTWTPGGVGVAHSEPERKEYRSIVGIRDALTTRARSGSRKSPREHLSAVASAMLASEVAEKSRERWYDDLTKGSAGKAAGAAAPDSEAIKELADAAIVAEGASKARVSWLILAITERDPEAPPPDQ